MDAPKRIWLDWPGANRGDPVFDEPPEHDMQAGQTPYILATPEALAASPEVAKLVAEAEARGMERAAMTVAQGWCVPPNTRKTFDPDLATGIQNVIRARASAIRRAAEGTGT